MTTTRRTFLSHTLPLAAGVGLINLPDRAGAASPAITASDAGSTFQIHPVGRVEKEGATVRLRLFDQYTDGLLGLEEWSHVNVFYWFDQNDAPPQRRTLRVHPRGNPKNPLTGVFACRAPVRPNLIALSVCRILAVKGNLVIVDQIDAFDATPIIDLKPFTPGDAPSAGVKVPAWAG
jgi:tRNA-Thr(GGU) m(6)t(6)A37 methyltransferase TsaA